MPRGDGSYAGAYGAVTGLPTSGANLREIGLAMACLKGGSGARRAPAAVSIAASKWDLLEKGATGMLPATQGFGRRPWQFAGASSRRGLEGGGRASRADCEDRLARHGTIGSHRR